MKKLMVTLAIVAVIGVSLAAAGVVHAQSNTPQAPLDGTGFGYGYGGRGGMMGGWAAGVDQDGLLHDDMVAFYAEKLGISVDDLNTRLANGETLAQIATTQGLSFDEFRALMVEAHTTVIDQAAQNGTLTQEQADWMNSRGAGVAAGGRGMRGAGQGLQAYPGCPYYGN